MMRDRDFGMIRLRAFGIYSFRVVDPVAFLKEVFELPHTLPLKALKGRLSAL